MREPGLDRHEWQARWEALEPLVADSPSEALPEVDRLVEEMLLERGYAVDEDVAPEGAEPEVVVEFREAHEVALRLDAGESVDPGELGAAVRGYRSLYEQLLEERRTP